MNHPVYLFTVQTVRTEGKTGTPFSYTHLSERVIIIAPVSVRNDPPAPRSASVSSINKPKPSVPAKPSKRRSVAEDSVVSSDKEALVPSKASSEADSESK